MFELSVFLKESLLGRSTFTDDEVRIGRSADNEVQIDNLALSRYHASIETREDLHLLKDFGSDNGTWVNGERVEGRRALNDGDRIGVGKFTLVFRTGGAKAPKPEAPPTARDEASYAVAGMTMVGSPAAATEARERTCPFVGYLEPILASPSGKCPEVQPLTKDAFVLGSSRVCDLVLEKAGCAERAVAIVRGFRGFSLLALAPGTTRNGKPVELKADLVPGDVVGVGQARFRFHSARPGAAP